MSNKIVSEIIVIYSEIMPPSVDFVISQIRKQGFEPIRWAIVNVEGNNIKLSVSGYKI